MKLGLVVEGDGEKSALPIIVRRHLHENREIFNVGVEVPKNSKGRGNLEAPGGVERFAQYAAIPDEVGGVLVLCDSDRDPVCEFGPTIETRAAAAVRSKPVRATLAVAEFENWIVASAESIAGAEPVDTDDFETLGAVSIVSRWRHPRAYVKPLHQPGYAQQMDFELVQARCPSFARLIRCIDELVDDILG
jgi:Domain of unknown function (DUF4276)